VVVAEVDPLEPEEVEWFYRCLEGAAEEDVEFVCDSIFAARILATAAAGALTPPQIGRAA
jgi:hypothetical protein